MDYLELLNTAIQASPMFAIAAVSLWALIKMTNKFVSLGDTVQKISGTVKSIAEEFTESVHKISDDSADERDKFLSTITELSEAIDRVSNEMKYHNTQSKITSREMVDEIKDAITESHKSIINEIKKGKENR